MLGQYSDAKLFKNSNFSLLAVKWQQFANFQTFAETDIWISTGFSVNVHFVFCFILRI